MERRKLIRSMALGMGGLMLAPEVLKATATKTKNVLTVAHITDVHIREDLNAPERFKKSLKQIISRHQPDFFLNGGDSIYDASYNHVKRERVTALWDIWDDCIATVSQKYEVYSCIGNHDPWWAAPAKDDSMYGIPYVVKRLKIPARYYSIKKVNGISLSWMAIIKVLPLMMNNINGWRIHCSRCPLMSLWC